MRYVLVLLFCATTSLAAPVPKPKPFDTSSMVGNWKYDWGGMKDGHISLFKDGTYRAKHFPERGEWWYGEWWLDAGNYKFRERRISENGEVGSWSCIYEFKIDSKNYPLRVTCSSGFDIVLRNKVEFAED